MISGAKSGANFSLKAFCNLVKRVEVVILLLFITFIACEKEQSKNLLVAHNPCDIISDYVW